MRQRRAARAARAGSHLSPRAASVLPRDASERRLLFQAGVLMGLLTLAAYANSFTSGLVIDSAPIIVSDPRVHAWSLDTLKLIFTRDYWWPETSSDLYRPLTTLSYWANYTLLGNGTDVTGYHAVNFALHWLNSWLVFVVMRRLSGRLLFSMLSGAVFAVHPVHTEAVTNVIGRADLLATLCVLVAGLCYIRAAESGGAAKVRWLAAVGGITCIGVLSKETAVLAGVFVVLYDMIWRWPGIAGTTTTARLKLAVNEFVLKGWVALVPAAALVLIVRSVVGYHTTTFGQSFLMNPIAGADWFSGVMTAWKVMGRCIGLLVFPRTLSSDYSYNQITLYGEPGAAWGDAASWAALAVIIGLAWIAVRLRRRKAMVAWGILFFLLAAVPTSNLFFPIGSILGERFLYLPSIGFCAVAAELIIGAAVRLAALRPTVRVSRRRLAWGIGAVVVTVLAARSLIRNADWRDDRSIWSSAVAASPHSFNAHRGFAGALLTGRDRTEPLIDSAIVSAERALEIIDNPPLPMERSDSRVMLDLGLYYRLKALKLRARGAETQAVAYLHRSVAVLERGREFDRWFNAESRAALVRRGHSPERVRDAGLAPIYFELGDTHLELRDWASARASAQYAQHIAPRAQRGYLIDGVAAFYARRPDEAAVLIAVSLLVDVARPDLWDNLAACFGAMGLAPPIVERNGVRAFDAGSPLGQQLVARAAAMLVRRFHEGKWDDEAERWREKLTREYGLPASAFAPGSPSRQP